jgi:tripartite-type tricarboxylate transporter receptor subunit TctC
MRKLVLLVAIAAVLQGTGSATAQVYPARSITMIVPFAAGGITDTVARIVSDRMKTALGQAVVVENVTGAGGTIGLTRLFRSAPDGYTLAVGQWTSNVGSGAIYPLPFDLLNDFEPVSMLSIGPLWIMGSNNLPAKNLKELIGWLKENPDKASAGTVGAGSAAHMCFVYFQNMTTTRFKFVPYRGAAPALQDLVGGHIDLLCAEGGQTLSQYRAGSIRAFAVLTQDRWFAAPDVPTMEEAGVPGLQFPFWHGLWAPKGTPKEIIATLNAAVVEALADPSVRERYTDVGHEVAPRQQQTPEGLHAYHKAEIEKWWPIIRAANVKAQ